MRWLSIKGENNKTEGKCTYSSDLIKILPASKSIDGKNVQFGSLPFRATDYHWKEWSLHNADQNERSELLNVIVDHLAD